MAKAAADHPEPGNQQPSGSGTTAPEAGRQGRGRKGNPHSRQALTARRQGQVSRQPGGPLRRSGPVHLPPQPPRRTGVPWLLALLLHSAAPAAAGPSLPRERAHAEAGRATPPRGQAAPCHQLGQRHVDAIVYGDEPAAILTALELARQLRFFPATQRPRLLLLTEADSRAGLGGTISRGELAYLDRNQIPEDLTDQLPPFAPSSELYSRFLRLTGVRRIAVDPQRAARVFRRELQRAAIPVLDRVALERTVQEGHRLCVLDTANHGSLGADLFIDASIGASLAHAAGVPFRPGLGPGRLAASSLSLGWIFTLEGLSLRRLQELEETLTWRLLNPYDREAQGWIVLWPAYRHNRRRLRNALLDPSGRPRLIRSYTSDSADQQSPALGIAFHGQSSRSPGLEHGPVLLDKANVALLNGRLSVNALLFRNDERQNRAVLAAHNRPLPWMEPVARDLEHFFGRYGGRLHWAPELYVRSADQIAHPRRALNVEAMALGGVRAPEALGTFTYALDLRGGLPGIDLAPMARPTFNFGYGHTLPRELRNLAVLGPASGFGGLAAGAGRIVELNVSVGQGLAIAAARALQAPGALRGSLPEVDPRLVASRMPGRIAPYGRPTSGTLLEVLLRRLRDGLDRLGLVI